MPAVDEIVEKLRRSSQRYLEFLRVPSMSLGLYVLPAGAEDRQSPHRQDEVYHVLRGKATFELRGERRPVRSGDILFVAANEPHRFHAIEEELVLFVVFAPSEDPTA